jgi:long-chain acyl-CoA synthetase
MSDRLNKLLECRRKNQLPEYREQLQYLDDEENVLLDLYLRRVALGEIQEDITGYPSLDKIWLKYYQEEYIRADIPYMTIIEYLKESNKNNMKQIAINPLENKGILTYEELFQMIDKVASSLDSLEIYKGDVIMGILPSVTAHEVYLLYAADIVGAAVNFMPEGTVVSDICHQINQFNVDYLFITDNSLGVEMEEELYSKTQLKAIIVVGTKNEKHRKQNTITWQKFMDLGTGRKVPEINRNPEDLLFIAKTGGTTGEPKNVLLNDNCFNIMVHQYLHSDLNYNTGDKWLRLWSLFSASAAISSSHLALCAGMENILRESYQRLIP